VIFRRPSFVGQRYTLTIRLFRRGADIAALGAFHHEDAQGAADDSRASVYLRFDGRWA